MTFGVAVRAMMTSIPKIIHQTWKTGDIPARFRRYSETWKRSLPDWEHRLWTDDSARELVARRFPGLLHKYDNYPFNIQRVDVARLLFLIEYGGLYVDMGFEALRQCSARLVPRRAQIGTSIE